MVQISSDHIYVTIDIFLAESWGVKLTFPKEDGLPIISNVNLILSHRWRYWESPLGRSWNRIQVCMFGDFEYSI